MPTVFISYSRRDGDFVERLHEGLSARGHDTWVDWEGIPPSDKWMATIRDAIDKAEAFVFVISPASLASQVCGEELRHAVDRHKRLIPVLHREPDSEVPTALAELNYVFSRETDDFKTAMDALVAAIDTDLDWVRAHTRLLVRASEWDREGREASFTLRGTDLTTFEDWAARAPDRDPKPTALQTEYLLASRRAVARRQRIIFVSIAAGLVIAAVLGTLAWLQKIERDRQTEIVAARQLLSRAAFERDEGPGDGAPGGPPEMSIRHAASALLAFDRLGVPVGDADLSLRKSIENHLPWRRHALPPGIQIRSAAFGTDGRLLAIGTAGDGVSIWDVTSGARRAHCNPEPEAGAGQSFWQVALSDDGGVLAAYEAPRSNKDPDGHFRIWRLPGCELVLERIVSDEETSTGDIRRLRVAPDGSAVALLTRKQLYLMTPDGREIAHPLDDVSRARTLVFSPDGLRLAVYEHKLPDGTRERTLLVWPVDAPHDRRRIRLPGRPEMLVWRTGGFEIDGQAMKEENDVLVPIGKGEVPAAAGLPWGLLAKAPMLSGLVNRIRTDGLRELAAPSPEPDLFGVLEPEKRRFGQIYVSPQRTAYAIVSVLPDLTDTIAFDATGRLLLARAGERAIAWRLPDRATGSAPVRREESLVAAETPLATAVVGAMETTGPDGRVYRIDMGEELRGGTARTLEIWKAAEKTGSRDIGTHLDPALAEQIYFTGQGRFLVIADSGGLHLLDRDTLEKVASPFHPRAKLATATPQGDVAATIDESGLVLVHDLGREVELLRFSGIPDARALVLSPDHRWLAVLAKPDRVLLYALEPADLIAQACRWLTPPCP